MHGGHRGLKAALIAVGAFAVGLAAGAALWTGSDAGDDEPTAAAGAAAAGDLYVVEGRLAAARTSGSDTLEVELEGATVLWFSDRPARLQGNRPIARFVAEWPATFGADQPNGAALAPSGEQSPGPVVVELERPTFDRSSGVASFVLRPEGGSESPGARRLSTALDQARSQGGTLVLFVDSGAPVPSPPSSPSEAMEVAAAFAEAQQAISVLQSVAAGGGTLSTMAEADLEALLQQAGAGR